LLPTDDMTFLDRTDAGRQLAPLVRAHGLRDPLVLGITRGGVPVAAEIARALAAPLDLCVVRKLLTRDGVGIGAIAEGGGLYLDDARAAKLGVHPDEVSRLVQRETSEVDRLALLLRDERPRSVRDRDVILADDGLVSAATLIAAARGLRERGARRIEVAVPVAAMAAIELLRPEVERITSLIVDELVVAIGTRYRDFSAISEAEVVDQLAGSRRTSTSSSTPSSSATFTGFVR
jgi:putative phosphoribosyl transferase